MARFPRFDMVVCLPGGRNSDAARLRGGEVYERAHVAGLCDVYYPPTVGEVEVGIEPGLRPVHNTCYAPAVVILCMADVTPQLIADVRESVSGSPALILDITTDTLDPNLMGWNGRTFDEEEFCDEKREYLASGAWSDDLRTLFGIVEHVTVSYPAMLPIVREYTEHVSHVPDAYARDKNSQAAFAEAMGFAIGNARRRGMQRMHAHRPPHRGMWRCRWSMWALSGVLPRMWQRVVLGHLV